MSCLTLLGAEAGVPDPTRFRGLQNSSVTQTLKLAAAKDSSNHHLLQMHSSLQSTRCVQATSHHHMAEAAAKSGEFGRVQPIRSRTACLALKSTNRRVCLQPKPVRTSGTNGIHVHVQCTYVLVHYSVPHQASRTELQNRQLCKSAFIVYPNTLMMLTLVVLTHVGPVSH